MKDSNQISDCKIYHQNIQSLSNKQDSLLLNLYDCNADIVCLTEHWLSASNINLVSLENFVLVSSFCRSTFKHGGVAIYCRKEMFKHIDEIKLNSSTEKNFEICGAKITMHNHKCLKVFCIYRSPSTNVNTFLLELSNFLETNLKSNEKVVICGDFNVDFLKNSYEKWDLSDTLNSYGFTCHNNNATRTIAGSSSSIDYICSTLMENDVVYNIEFNGLSDHSAQILTLKNFANISKNQKKFIYRRIFSNQNYNVLNYLLQQELWLDVYEANTVNDACRIFVESLSYYINISFPVIKISHHNSKKPWISIGIQTSAKNLKALFNLSKDSGSLVLTEYYKKYKKIYDKVIVLAKRKYNDNVYRQSSNKAKTAWNIIKGSFGSDVNNRLEQIEINGTLLENSSDIANAFNTFFIEQPLVLRSDNLNSNHSTLNVNVNKKTMFFSPISEHDIVRIVNSLKKSNSTGLDNISTNILKANLHYVAQPLSYIFNMSLENATFPDVLKTARVIPLYKKGDKKLVENYRPISLLSVISKILEKIVFQQMFNFLIQNDVLTECQHGFCKGKSTTSALLQLMTEIYNHINENDKLLILFMDLSKAFDLVDHDLLLGKINNYGLRGLVNDWVQSYLSQRFQIVEVNKKRSTKIPNNIGVP